MYVSSIDDQKNCIFSGEMVPLNKIKYCLPGYCKKLVK
jgi:hypothetical protein